MRTILNQKTRSSLLLLIAALTLSTVLNAIMILPAHALETPKLFVEPENNIFYTTDMGINSTFKINVTLANTTGLVGTQFRVYWNSTLLAGVNMTEVLYTSNTPAGEEDNIWKLKHVVAADHIEYAYTYLDVGRGTSGGYLPINITTTTNPPSGKRTVCTIALRVKAVPAPGQILNCTLKVNTTILGDQVGDPITHEVVNGYYELRAPPTPAPTLKVEPATYEATHRNETFNVNITMNNLDAGSEAIGVEFKLRYDPTLLKINNVTEGPFMAAFGGSPNQGTFFLKLNRSDYMNVGIMIFPDENGTWHTPFPSGNGTLATIIFEVISGPVVSCNLDLFETIISDWNTTPIDHTAQDGAFVFNYEILTHNVVADGQNFLVVTKSNATVSPVTCAPRQRMLIFNATGPDGGVCFVNITIPKTLLSLELISDNWLVFVGGFPVTPTAGGNSTHTWLYFTFTTSLKPVQITGTAAIPEYPALAILPLLFATLTAVILSNRRKLKKSMTIEKSTP